MSTVTALQSDRYGVVVTDETATIFDEENANAWIESSEHVPIEEVA